MIKTAILIIACIIPFRSFRHSFRRFLLKTFVYKEHITKVKKVFPLLKYVEFYEKIGTLLNTLKPYDVIGQNKIRVGDNGPNGDGGYVMLQQNSSKKIAYSFGISNYSPWDLEMAQNGYEVFQYDATIKTNPDKHPNLHFYKYNIGTSNVGDYKSIKQIIAEHGHQDENDIILQMDIDGGEWDVLEAIENDVLNHFRQIIIEYHFLYPWSEDFKKFIKILDKINITHTPYHVHFNNGSKEELSLSGILNFSHVVEVSYARKTSYEFKSIKEYFPTELDRPNVGTEDIEIGSWE